MMYQKKPKIVDAEQYKGDPATACRGVRVDEDGFVYVVPIQGNKVGVKSGEWIIDEGDGIHFYPVAYEVFMREFAEVPT